MMMLEMDPRGKRIRGRSNKFMDAVKENMRATGGGRGTDEGAEDEGGEG